ncbi:MULTISPECIES: tetratricopeptide repeat protein [unclassified Streptomyces]|uniref:tetratricopeptide repeat protein n=1 Tax=unclassified Streptomyces TaxID=2593676 RepID=UPI000DACD3DE|nr:MULTISPECIES: tetratricopeptide repeat protein [unclassified Streptomyces]PZT71890.1 tetratricopeptide repeat protein [Streptomyces sp. AC1-42T]PZT81783.1 tetratricopeptide repeat protein [Streptomyces sp. AC1-42W]
MVSAGAVPNLAFRRLRGPRSAGEFAAAVRRAAREIGEQVACDARYIGRVESGEIRCPNYAYERVFRHMFPGTTLEDLGFSPRASVRGRAAGPAPDTPTHPPTAPPPAPGSDTDEESDVLRRVFMTSGTTTVAAASLGLGLGGPAASLPLQRRVGETEVSAVERAVRQIRLLDDRHGGDRLYRRAAQPLRAAYALLDAGTAQRRSMVDRLHSGAGELALSVGWLAHDSGRFEDARSHYAEALATARVAGDPALEAHAFCNTSFLARDTGRPREAVRAAEAGLRAAEPLGSPRLRALLALREAGGRAGLGDRTGCERALGQAHTAFARGASGADPEWMSFFREAELEMLEAQCWAALGDWSRAARHAGRAVRLQDPHFTRNLALYRAELTVDLARAGRAEEAAASGHEVLDLLDRVQSSRIRAMLRDAAAALEPRSGVSGPVRAFLDRHRAGRAGV